MKPKLSNPMLINFSEFGAITLIFFWLLNFSAFCIIKCPSWFFMLWKTMGTLKYLWPKVEIKTAINTHTHTHSKLTCRVAMVANLLIFTRRVAWGAMPLISELLVLRYFFLESFWTLWIHLHMKQRVAFLKSSLSSSVMSISLFSCILSFVPSLISLNMFIAENTDSISSPLQKKNHVWHCQQH